MKDKISPSDLRKEAQKLIKDGKMPSLDDLLKHIAEERETIKPEVERLRKEGK